MSGYRAMRRVDGQWQTEQPDNLSSWLWAHDGEEAVVVNDVGKIYYCGRPEMVEQYKAAWAKEGKRGDKRQASTFQDLDRQLFAAETPIMPDCSPAWCQSGGCLCSEVAVCNGICL